MMSAWRGRRLEKNQKYNKNLQDFTRKLGQKLRRFLNFKNLVDIIYDLHDAFSIFTKPQSKFRAVTLMFSAPVGQV